MNQAAAIKRASQQARNAMRNLDAQALEDLLGMYQAAGDQVRAALRARADSTDTVPQSQLQALQRQIEDIVLGLGQQRDALLNGQIDQAAGLGVRPFTPQGLAAVGGTEAVLTSTDAAAVHQNAVAFVQRFRAVDGLTLSDRLWRIDQGAKEVLQRAIGNAVVQGWSGTRAARDLLVQGLPVPADVAGQVAAGKVDQLVRVADLLHTGDGAEVWKAERVLRTEINRAHGEAFMAAGAKTPGFGGWRFLLSPAHPRADICDLYAAQNLYGLGEGVYPNRSACPWPAHPNTLSFVEMVFKDELTDAQAAAKETPLEALQRLAPAVREGVLGPTKAGYFDQGVLAQGGIRGKVGAVRARLQRQGVL